MRGYLKAWASDAPEDIAALFTENARYFTEPYAEPWTGRDAIVSEWIAHGDSGTEWSFEYDVTAQCDDTAIVRGVTRYAAESPDQPAKTYHNLWIVRLDAGRPRVRVHGMVDEGEVGVAPLDARPASVRGTT